eukprot:m.77860 g.77860  ORF g.77860 m.77860 type:complete len:360 (+) comp10641_c0_seq1:177-1256(+)
MRVLSWAFAARVAGVIAVFLLGVQWGRQFSTGGAPRPIAVAQKLPPIVAKPGRAMPSKPFGHCWPEPDSCEFYGLCNSHNPFAPKITGEALAHCGPLSTDDSKDKELQMYHVSKCGGTTINTLIKSKAQGGAGGLTDKGDKLHRHERENAWDPMYTGGTRPTSSFIIGTIRNPFEYYVSFWSMFTLTKMKGTQDCLRRSAIEAGRKDLFDTRGRSNVKQFQAWLHFLFVDSCDPCALSMWRVFQALYIGAPGHCPSYDRLVRLENFYPTLTTALQDYEKYSPGTVNWKVVHEWETQRKNTIRDGPVCPYHCYYDDHARELVELHDAPLLAHFNYSFEETAQRHGGSEACRNSICYNNGQ